MVVDRWVQWRYCCALALEAVSGVYTNVKGEVVTIESVA